MPTKEILSHLPDSKKTKIISYWDSKTSNFLKTGAVRWSKQRNTQNTALIIEGGDGFSSQGATDLIGILEQNFARDLVIVVSSVHKIPDHVIQRGKLVHSTQIPSLMEGWTNYTPDINDYEGWSRIIRT